MSSSRSAMSAARLSGVRIALLCTALFFATVAAAAEVGGGEAAALTSADKGSQSGVICTCRCCYLGECRPFSNATWMMDSCLQCTSDVCRTFVRSDGVRRQTAHVFELLQDGVPLAEKRAMRLDVCEVVSVLEASTCPVTDNFCKRTTDLKAECFDRSAPLQKYCVWSFVWILFAATVLGFTKNYIPALQHFNRKHFDY